MSTLTHGMDLAAVEELGRFLAARADDLGHLVEQVDAQVRSTSWGGPDADRFRGEAWPRDRTVLRSVVEGLRDLSRSVADHAAQQRSASTDGGSIASTSDFCAATPTPEATRRGRDLLAHLVGLTDGPVTQGHIAVERLADGSVVVVLPGVEDLSSSGGSGLRWAGRGAILGLPGVFAGFVGGAVSEAIRTGDSPRDLAYTAPTALDPGNDDRYARAVREALEREGIPAGTSVMLVGHSGGAYAAMSLASNPSFNANLGADGRYDLTHVVAVGADTDQFLPRISTGTEVLVLNNSGDLVSQIERVAGAPSSFGLRTEGGWSHVEETFDGGLAGDVGHDPQRIVDFLSGDRGSDALDRFAASAGLRYGDVDRGQPTNVVVRAR